MYVYLYVYICDSIYLSVCLSNSREREIYYEKLLHAVMETEKAHDLSFASWRPGKAGGITQSEPEGQRTRGMMM